MRNFEIWKKKTPSHKKVSMENIENLIAAADQFEMQVYSNSKKSFENIIAFKSMFAGWSRWISISLMNILSEIHEIEYDDADKKFTVGKMIDNIEELKFYPDRTIKDLKYINKISNSLSHPNPEKYKNLGKGDFVHYLKCTHFAIATIFGIGDNNFDIRIYRRKYLNQRMNADIEINTIEIPKYDADEFINIAAESIFDNESSGGRLSNFDSSKASVTIDNDELVEEVIEISDFDYEFDELSEYIESEDADEVSLSELKDESILPLFKTNEINNSKSNERKTIIGGGEISLEGLDFSVDSEEESVRKFKDRWKK